MTAQEAAHGRTDPGEGDGTGGGDPTAQEAVQRSALDAAIEAAWDRCGPVLTARFTRALLDEAANWEHTFPDGNTGIVISLPDAAVVAARTAHELIQQVAREVGRG